MKTYTENLTMKRLLTTVFALLTLHASFAADVLVEAESFADKGGWAVDQQFMDLMGSPYLIAHGMGVTTGLRLGTRARVPAASAWALTASSRQRN